MTTQREEVERIDRSSTVRLGEERVRRRSRFATFLALIFLPGFRFLRLYVLSGGFLRGLAGFREGVNQAMAVFVLEAKRYERDYADPSELEAIAEEFDEDDSLSGRQER